MKSTSKHRTLKKVFLNVTACLTALVVTGNIIANECEVQLNSFLGTSSTKIVTNLPEGVTEEGYVRYYDSKYSTLAELKAAGNAKVREVEGEGIVLMKNEGSVLPLSAGAKVSLVGVTAMDPVYGGTGSGAGGAGTAVFFSQGKGWVMGDSSSDGRRACGRRHSLSRTSIPSRADTDANHTTTPRTATTQAPPNKLR